jgi:hypothetical protein
MIRKSLVVALSALLFNVVVPATAWANCPVILGWSGC